MKRASKSSVFSVLQILWTPVFTGETNTNVIFSNLLRIEERGLRRGALLNGVLNPDFFKRSIHDLNSLIDISLLNR